MEIRNLPRRIAVAMGGVFTVILLAWRISVLHGGQGPRTFYVDNAMAGRANYTGHCIRSYDPTTRHCGGGSETAYKSLYDASVFAYPGDTVIIRGGTFHENLAPRRSGTKDKPITFTAMDNETVIITEKGAPLYPAIELSNRSHIIIDGLTVTNVRRYLRADNAHYNVIRNCRFTGAYATDRAVMRFADGSTFNRFVNNYVQGGGDLIVIKNADHNLVQDNIFYNAAHSIFSIRCGSFNVIRGNTFVNEYQKIGEVYDCCDLGLDIPTRCNLIEGNIFSFVPPHRNRTPFAGIQYAGQYSIIRRNIFSHNAGPGLLLGLWPGRQCPGGASWEASRNLGNRIYHNVFYDNRLAAVDLTGKVNVPHAFEDNVFKNNIFCDNRYEQQDTRFWFFGVLNGKAVHVKTGRVEGFRFETNNIFSGGSDWAVVAGGREPLLKPANNPLAWWQSSHAELFAGNIDADPQFVDAPNGDFRLRPGSAMIDAGTFLTLTVGAGAGTRLPVADCTWFYDGYDIPGQRGDLIQVQGRTDTARVIDIDYDNNILILDRSLTWTENQGVALAFQSTAPDIGLVEAAPLDPADYNADLYINWLDFASLVQPD